MASFCAWGSTVSRLQSKVDSLLFTIQFPAGPGTQLIDIGRIKGRINLGATQWFCT